MNNLVKDSKIEIVKPFENKEFSIKGFDGKIRALKINDEPYFVAKDLAKALGYSTLQRMYDHVEREDKVKINPQDKRYQGLCENGTSLKLEENPNIFTLMIINESGLYDAIFGSKLESARKFKRWVTSEVLPTIRKTGGFVQEQKEEEFIEQMFPSLDESTKQILLKDLIKKNKELKTKADYHDKVLNPSEFKKLLTSTQISKDLGISARKLNKVLNENGIIYKQGKSWMLYSKYEHFISEEYDYADYHITEYGQTLKWTEKGRKWIVENWDNFNK